MLRSLALSRRNAFAALFTGAALSASAFFIVPQSFDSVAVVLAFGLAWASFVDLEKLIVPDLITIGLVLAGLVVSFSLGGVSTLDALAGALAGYGLLVLVAQLFAAARGREGLGRGDAKLFAAAGAWLGWQFLPAVLLTASASALVLIGVVVAVKGRAIIEQPIPFGPFISAAFWLCWIYQASM